MKKAFTLLIAISTLFGCSLNEKEIIDELNIRIANVSQYDFKNIIINTSTGNTSYDDMNSGQKSGYKTFTIAYKYAYVQLEIDGKEYTIQPTDYTGETPLNSGKYTYEIDANKSLEKTDKLSLKLIEE